MAKIMLNRFTCSLKDYLGEHIFEEKWLIAVTLRAGFQWLESVVRAGQSILNVHVKTLKNAVLECARAGMEKSGVRFVTAAEEEMIIARIFGKIAGGGSGYLAVLEPGHKLAASIAGTIRDMRLAGIGERDIRPEFFESELKAKEIGRMFAEFNNELKNRKLFDYAGVLKTAIKNPPPHIRFIMPRDGEEALTGLEKKFWNSLPKERRIVLPVDEPCNFPGEKYSDADLLSYVMNPAEAPGPRHDGSVRVFRATGEVNEVHEVFRQCMENGISFDDAEIICTDGAAYIPLIYETALEISGAGAESVPVTFADGIPVTYSRPARALAGLFSWIRNEYTQSELTGLLREGLLKTTAGESHDVSYSRLAEILRCLRIGKGKERYGRIIKTVLDNVRTGEESRYIKFTKKGSREEAKIPKEQQIKSLEIIEKLVSDVLAYNIEPGNAQKTIVDGVMSFLENRSRRVNRFDEYCHQLFMEKLNELRDIIGDDEIPGLDVMKWIEERILSLNANAQRPREGCIHVSTVYRGGHSGRKNTFIVGLDDGRFPGGSNQDPLMLDGERKKISGQLPTSTGIQMKKERDFVSLLSRLRGNVTLSYSSRNLTDDTDNSPGKVIWSAFRLLSEKPEGDLDDLNDWLDDPVSFAPVCTPHCISPREWWLWRLCTGRSINNLNEVMAELYPHLNRGIKAVRERKSENFTIYDGFVPEAGKDYNPFKPGGFTISATAIETLGSCPMDFFFRYVLEIEKPETYKMSDAYWLEPFEIGNLLHSVFREFMSRLKAEELKPQVDRDEPLLMKILTQEIRSWKQIKPPPNDDVFDRTVRDLELAARIFLIEEEAQCRTVEPAFFEAAIGMQPEGTGTDIDDPEPAEIIVCNGKIIKARGRIDRIDRVPGSTSFMLWDYKTGSTWKYKKDSGKKGYHPYWQGRVVQNVLYSEMAKTVLKRKLSPEARVTSFGYFFPTGKGGGERIITGENELEAGKSILTMLCEMIAAGCFPYTDESGDVTYSDYKEITGDPDNAAEQIKRKLNNPGNELLALYRKLREYEGQNGNT